MMLGPLGDKVADQETDNHAPHRPPVNLHSATSFRAKPTAATS